jgi:hypothetical protein
MSVLSKGTILPSGNDAKHNHSWQRPFFCRPAGQRREHTPRHALVGPPNGARNADPCCRPAKGR